MQPGEGGSHFCDTMYKGPFVTLKCLFSHFNVTEGEGGRLVTNFSNLRGTTPYSLN